MIQSIYRPNNFLIFHLKIHKKNLLFQFLILCSFNLFSQSFNFSDLEKINNNLNDNYRPKICLVDGDPLIIYTSNVPEKKIFLNRKKDGLWLGEQQISPDSTNFQLSNRIGPALASYGDIVYVAYVIESTPRKIVYQKSIDGGITFSSLVPVFELNENYALGLDMMILPDGNPVFAFIYYDSLWSNIQQVLIRSYDYGSTFTDLISIDESPCECCKPSLVKGDGNYYGVSFRENDSNIRVFKTRISSVTDANFYSPVLTDHTNWQSIVCPSSPSDGFLVNDTLYNVWMSSPDDLSKVYMSKTNMLNGEIFESFEVDFTLGSNSQNHPKIGGNKMVQLVAWEETRGSKKDILAKLIFNGQSFPSFSLTDGDSISHMESVDVIFDNQSNLFHITYRNKEQSSVMYRYLEPTFLKIDSPPLNTLKLHPNPSQNKIFISGNFDEQSNYIIFNSLGVPVKKGIFDGEVSIFSLTEGYYVIQIFNSSKYYRLPFLKVKE